MRTDLVVPACLAAVASIALPVQALAQGFMTIEGQAYAYFETSALIDRIGCSSGVPRTCNSSPSLTGDHVVFAGLEFMAVRDNVPLDGFGQGYSLIADANAISTLYDRFTAGDEFKIAAFLGDDASDYYASSDDFGCSEDNTELICHVLYYGVVRDGPTGQYVDVEGFYTYDSKNLFFTMLEGLSGGVLTIVDILN